MSANDATKYVLVSHLDGEGLKSSSRWIFSVMFSPTIMLLIGGFTISSALSKTNIDRILITRVLSLAGSDPNTVLLAFMGVSCFASMWIRSVLCIIYHYFLFEHRPHSNVAAPTLCFTLIRVCRFPLDHFSVDFNSTSLSCVHYLLTRLLPLASL